MVKTCYKCKEEKPITEFTKKSNQKDGLNPLCKTCKHLKQKRYRERNKDKIKIYGEKYYIENKDFLLEYGKKYGKEYYNKNRKSIIRQTMEWKHNNPEKVAATRKHYKKKNNLRVKMSNKIQEAMKRHGGSKNGSSWVKVLNYNAEDLRVHLESLFEPGMSWKNYGSGPDHWCIDHVIPDSHFDYRLMEDEGFQCSWSLSNLQPMWFNENSSKGNRYVGKFNPNK